MVQRTRWATGMMQLLRYKNPLFLKNIRFAQRIGYFNTMFYWLFGLAHIIFVLSPAMALLFGAILFSAPPVEIFLYVVPYLLAIYLSMHMLYGRVRWLFVSEVYETIQAFSTLLTPLKTLLLPAGKMFYVTPKEESSEHDTVSSLSKNFYILFAVLMLSAGVGLYHMLHDENGVEYYLVSLLWNSYNLIFVLAALGALIEIKQRRHRPRIAVNRVAQVVIGGRSVPCNIENINEDGALLRLPEWAKAAAHEQGKLLLCGTKAIEGCITRTLGKLSDIPLHVVRVTSVEHAEGHCLYVGVRFTCEEIEQSRTLIAFIYGDSDLWRQVLKARNKPSTLGQGATFLIGSAWCGLYHLKMVFALLLRRKPIFQVEKDQI